jgi:hypothetical protein
LKFLECVLGTDALKPPRAHLAGASRIQQERSQRCRKPLDIAMRNERTRNFVLNHVRGSSVRSANHRFAVRHGLKKHEAKTFTAAGKRKNTASGVTGEQFVWRQILQENSAIGNAVIAGKLLEPRPVFAAANQYEKSIWRRLQHARQSRD